VSWCLFFAGVFFCLAVVCLVFTVSWLIAVVIF